jgi:predicted  nucleic acid-binding Zn-ribbon protein
MKFFFKVAVNTASTEGNALRAEKDDLQFKVDKLTSEIEAKDYDVQRSKDVIEAEAEMLRKQVKDLGAKTSIAENKLRESQNTITTLQVKIYFLIVIKMSNIAGNAQFIN